MPRNYKSTEVFLKPDPKYGSVLASKIINKLMWQGKKSVAQRLLYDAVEIVAKKVEKEPLENLAADGQLMAYQHEGFWQCMDTLRDKYLLNNLWESGKAPWKTWKD